jgi:hypothetical protein
LDLFLRGSGFFNPIAISASSRNLALPGLPFSRWPQTRSSPFCPLRENRGEIHRSLDTSGGAPLVFFLAMEDLPDYTSTFATQSTIYGCVSKGLKVRAAPGTAIFSTSFNLKKKLHFGPASNKVAPLAQPGGCLCIQLLLGALVFLKMGRSTRGKTFEILR